MTIISRYYPKAGTYRMPDFKTAHNITKSPVVAVPGIIAFTPYVLERPLKIDGFIFRQGNSNSQPNYWTFGIYKPDEFKRPWRLSYELGTHQSGIGEAGSKTAYVSTPHSLVVELDEPITLEAGIWWLASMNSDENVSSWIGPTWRTLSSITRAGYQDRLVPLESGQNTAPYWQCIVSEPLTLPAFIDTDTESSAPIKLEASYNYGPPLVGLRVAEMMDPSDGPELPELPELGE